MALLIIVDPAAKDSTLFDAVPSKILPEITPSLRMPPITVPPVDRLIALPVPDKVPVFTIAPDTVLLVSSIPLTVALMIPLLLILPPIVLAASAMPLAPLMVPELSTLPVIVELTLKLNPVYSSPVNKPLLLTLPITPLFNRMPLSIVPLLLTVPLIVEPNKPKPVLLAAITP